VREKDLATLTGLSSYSREKLEGMEFTDVNQVLQCAIAYENRTGDSHSNSRFREASNERDRGSAGMVEDNATSNEDTEICVAEWVDTPKGKPMTCSFLKLGAGKRDEMCFTFDVMKCDKLFDVLLQHNIIRLKEGHVVPIAEQLAWKKYCRWHNSFSHTTNECNYFQRHIQSALNDGRLTLGDAQ
jgi:hypothetical protein